MASAGLFSLACNAPPSINPWRDDAITRESWTTPSQEGILAGGDQPIVRQRDGNAPSSQVLQTADGVPHYSLWFEDPFEDKGDGDSKSAWTWADYVALPYSIGRFGVNAVASPVSAVVVPPGAKLVSDGKVGRDHDAARGQSPDPTATATDFTADDPLVELDTP